MCGRSLGRSRSGTELGAGRIDYYCRVSRARRRSGEIALSPPPAGAPPLAAPTPTPPHNRDKSPGRLAVTRETVQPRKGRGGNCRSGGGGGRVGGEAAGTRQGRRTRHRAPYERRTVSFRALHRSHASRSRVFSPESH